jgi:Uncharacterised nucleotidyltransferase
MKRACPRKPLGHLVAETLTGAWRRHPAALAMTAEELAEATPLLVGSGAAGLAWWRVRRTALQFTLEAEELQRAFHLNLIQASFHEQNIEKVFGLLRRAGVDALLIKGWAVARLYPERGMRPSGDIDLLIRPDQLETARAILKSPEAKHYFADFEHEEFQGLERREWDELAARSEVVRLGREDVRLMSPEDHLRLLCIHLLRHGAWRPLWLCDVAAVMEFRPRGFDWERCLGRDRRRAEWVICALGLAHHLLGARVDDTPVEGRRIPKWLVATVLKQWEKPCVIDRVGPELMTTSLRYPARIAGALRMRWPDPIQATIRMRGPINEWPRLPFQVGEYVSKAATFMTKLPESWREQGR